MGPPFLRHLAQCDVQHPIMGTALHTRCASEVRANKKDPDPPGPLRGPMQAEGLAELAGASRRDQGHPQHVDPVRGPFGTGSYSPSGHHEGYYRDNWAAVNVAAGMEVCRQMCA